MKESLDLLDIDKLKAANDFLDSARDKEIELKLKEHEKKVVNSVMAGFEKGESEVVERNLELTVWLVKMIDMANEKTQNEILSQLPKNQHLISKGLLEYRAGKLSGSANASASQRQSQDS